MGYPLAGVRVVALEQAVAAPFCTRHLADLGADVVKIERPDGGDDMRRWPPLNEGPRGEGYSENFASINRNKRSVTVDLKDAAQLARLKALCAKADVLIENYRPGVLERLGLGYEALRAASPRLVYC